MTELREHDTVLVSWTFPEYEQYARTGVWYGIAGVIGAALLIYAFSSRNFLFAIMIVMLAAVLYLRHVNAPRELEVALSERGMTLDGRFTPYDGFHDFWIAEREDETHVLYLHSKGVRPRTIIPLASVGVEQVREVLRLRVAEDEEAEEPASDAIGRALKL